MADNEQAVAAAEDQRVPHTVVEKIHHGFLWSVTTRVLPGPPARLQRILKFSNGEETDIDAYPMPEGLAAEIADALTKVPVETATPADMAALARAAAR